MKALNSLKSDPYYFVADQFDTHDVVFIGEMHKIKQDLDFFSKLIPYLYQKKKINIIGWEFGAAIYQKDADSVVNAPTFDRKKAITILRRSNFRWCYNEYLEIFHTIWQINKSVINFGERIRILPLNAPNIHRKRKSNDTATRNAKAKMYFDNFFPPIIEKKVLDKDQKILIYCGLHHSLTKFYTPKFLFLKDSGRGSQYLYKKYHGKIFQIIMSPPLPPRWWLFKSSQSAGIYPFDGVFNQLYASLKLPLAINANTRSFSEVKDFNSFYEFDSWNGIKIKDFCNGAIMIASFKDIVPVHLIKDWVTSQQDLDEVKSVTIPAETKNILAQQDFYNYIAPEDNGTAIKSFWK